MFNGFKNLFKLSNWKRWLVFAFAAFFGVAAISLASAYYIKPEANLSIDYAGGAELLIEVKDSEKKDASEKLTNNVSDQIFERLTGGTGLNGTSVNIEGTNKIRVSRNGIKTDKQLEDFKNETTRKPILTLMDVNGNPIFENGIFRPNIVYDEAKVKNNPNIYTPPFKENSAKSRLQPNSAGGSLVEIGLKNSAAETEWTKATEYISRLTQVINPRDTTGIQPNNILVAWLDLAGLRELAKTKFSDEWKKADENPYNFVFTNETRKPIEKTTSDPMSDGKLGIEKIPQILKKFEFNASNYMISAASVRQALTGSTFVITGKFSTDEANNLTNKINFGIADYDLELRSSSFISAGLGSNPFNLAVIAGIIVFLLIGFFMIFSYGVLGLITTLSLGLYLFFTLLIFTLLKGEYSPSSIAALVIGIGISVDANIINFERLKREIYKKDPLQKAFVKANSVSLRTILDANITTLLVAIALFYFGTKSVKGFSVTLILSTIFTLIIMLGFTRFASTLILKTKFFDNRLYLIGIRKKYIGQSEEVRANKPLNRFNYMQNAKWFAMGSAVFMILGAIVYFTLVFVNKNDFSAGLNSSIEFSGGTRAIISSDSTLSVNSITIDVANKIKETLINEHGIKESEIAPSPINSSGTIKYTVNILSKTLTQDKVDAISQSVQNINSHFNLFNSTVSSREATKLLANAFTAIAIAIVIVVAYVLIRLRWTFAIAAIIAIIHDILFITAAFILFRIQFSTIFVPALLSIIGYSINDTIVTFDRYKEIIKRYETDKINEKIIYGVSNKAVKDTIKRSLLTTFTTLTAVLVLMSFINATELSFNLALLIGLISGTYSSIFIATFILKRLEVWRWKLQQKRIKKKFWEIEKISEQTFYNINDFIH